jgi:thioesterase domain-containing protein
LDFSFIKTIWISRIKKPTKAKWISLIGDVETVRLRKKMKTLNLVSAAYIWKPLPVKITLIRSAPWISYHKFNERLSMWDRLALNGVDTYVVDGHHNNLFNEPDVKQLADQLRQCLDKANNDVANPPDNLVLSEEEARLAR